MTMADPIFGTVMSSMGDVDPALESLSESVSEGGGAWRFALAPFLDDLDDVTRCGSWVLTADFARLALRFATFDPAGFWEGSDDSRLRLDRRVDGIVVDSTGMVLLPFSLTILGPVYMCL